MRWPGLLRKRNNFARMPFIDWTQTIIQEKNMRQSLLLLMLASMLSIMMIQSAFAGNRPGAYTLTVGGAYDIFANKRNLDNAWLLPTVDIAYNINETWALEGTWGLFYATQVHQTDNQNVTGNIYTLDALYRFGSFDNRWEPYVSAGFGASHINPNGNDAQNEGNINAGVGTQLFFDKNIALRGEVRDLYTLNGGKNDVTLGFGVSFLFGGDTPVAKPVLYKDG
jgi:hypothetical protein